MAYTVLARRYRSGTFDEVIGQDHVAQTLKRAIESGRVAHAYLFTGTRGVGKTSMARILAKALNCLKFDKPTTTPCGECSSCQAIAKGEDIDVIEIDAASNTGVENVRDIIENARFRPARSRFKVYIIDEVHMLSKAAFNALLKIMEEPPEHVKFILATTEVDKILPTILSRCQRYDFRNIPSREIVDHLRRITKDEGVKAEEEALALVARAGAGSMRDSLSLLDRLLSVGEKTLTADMIEQLLGMPKSALIFDLADAIGVGDVKRTLETASRIVDGGLSSDTLIASLIEHFHNLLVVATCGAKSNLVDVVGVDADALEKQAKSFDVTALTTDIGILEELRRQMRSSQAGRALLDATLARLAMSAQFASIGELMAQLNGAPATPPRAGASPPRPAATATSSAAMPRSTPSAEKKTPELIAEASGSAWHGRPAREDSTGIPEIGSTPSAANHGRDARATQNEAASLVVATNSKGISAEIAVNELAVASAPTDDAADELPAVGKVAADGATRSLWQAFKKNVAPAKSVANGSAAGDAIAEEPHHAALRQQATEKLIGRHAAMFDQARVVGYDDSTGVVRLHFPADAEAQAAYVKRNRDVFAIAFAQIAGRDTTLELEVAEAPVEDSKPAQERKPRVIRPNLDEVAAEVKDQPMAPPNAVDIDAVKDDPLVQAILRTFEGSRVVRVE